MEPDTIQIDADRLVNNLRNQLSALHFEVIKQQTLIEQLLEEKNAPAITSAPAEAQKE